MNTTAPVIFDKTTEVFDRKSGTLLFFSITALVSALLLVSWAPSAVSLESKAWKLSKNPHLILILSTLGGSSLGSYVILILSRKNQERMIKQGTKKIFPESERDECKKFNQELKNKYTSLIKKLASPQLDLKSFDQIINKIPQEALYKQCLNKVSLGYKDIITNSQGVLKAITLHTDIKEQIKQTFNTILPKIKKKTSHSLIDMTSSLIQNLSKEPCEKEECKNIDKQAPQKNNDSIILKAKADIFNIFTEYREAFKNDKTKLALLGFLEKQIREKSNKEITKTEELISKINASYKKSISSKSFIRDNNLIMQNLKLKMKNLSDLLKKSSQKISGDRILDITNKLSAHKRIFQTKDLKNENYKKAISALRDKSLKKLKERLYLRELKHYLISCVTEGIQKPQILINNIKENLYPEKLPSQLANILKEIKVFLKNNLDTFYKEYLTIDSQMYIGNIDFSTKTSTGHIKINHLLQKAFIGSIFYKIKSTLFKKEMNALTKDEDAWEKERDFLSKLDQAKFRKLGRELYANIDVFIRRQISIFSNCNKVVGDLYPKSEIKNTSKKITLKIALESLHWDQFERYSNLEGLSTNSILKSCLRKIYDDRSDIAYSRIRAWYKAKGVSRKDRINKKNLQLLEGDSDRMLLPISKQSLKQ